MRRLALSVLAAFAFQRFLSWRRTKAVPAASPPAPEPVTPVEPEPEPDPRAEELRAKLEARDVEEEQGPEPAAIPEPDERRRSVHERGRRAAEQMRDSGTD